MENQKQKVENTQGEVSTVRVMSNGYIAKQLMLNAKRLFEKKAIDQPQYNSIREIGIEVLTNDL